MTRFVAVGLVVLGTFAGARVARAEESTPLPNGAVLQFERLVVENQNGDFSDPSTPEQVRHLLNGAHCACSRTDLTNQTFGYRVTLSADTALSRPVDIYVGTMCDDPLRINETCLKVDSIPSIDTIRIDGFKEIRIPLYQAVNVKKTMDACDPNTSSATVWLMVDTDGDTTYDHWVTTVVPDPYKDASIKGIDTKAPPLPLNRSAAGSENAIQIEWTLPADQSDLYYVQALCANLDDTPVAGITKPDKQLYDRPSDACMVTPTTFELEKSDPGIPREMPVDAAPAPFAMLDPAYLCGQAGMGDRSLTIKNLENNKPYKIALVAVDNYGNFAGTYFSTTVTPRVVTDLWEDLNERDSAIDGGCLLSTTYGDGNPLTQALRSFRDGTLARTAYGRWLIDAYYGTLGRLHVHSLPARIAAGIALAPLVALGLLWHLLTLPGLLVVLALPWLWRRRAALLGSRRLRLAAAAAVLALVALPRAARADDLMPYWEDPSTQDQSQLDVADTVKWHAGLRLGPYIPDIDRQVGKNAVTGKGPYEAMFGDYSINGDPRKRRVWQVLPMLDVDRILWSGFGQIGVGGSIGYMQKSAYAYVDGTSPDDVLRDRSTAARNTFRLIPLAATATYRLTYLDDRWGVPIVPYLRAGLAYYIWWIKAPNGNVAKVCADGSDAMDCDTDKAYGGSFGIQASAGLAIRAERVDRDAARSMRNSGIQHTGFYGEISFARVDGFGSESKLSVGDTTWFAGVNFEF